MAPPAGQGLDHAEHHEAEPEVHDQPEIYPEGHVPSLRRKIPHQQKIGRIPGEDSRQGVKEVGHLFRHT